MNKKIAKTLGTLLLLTAVAVTQVPVSDVEAVASASDFQMDGNKLMKSCLFLMMSEKSGRKPLQATTI